MISQMIKIIKNIKNKILYYWDTILSISRSTALIKYAIGRRFKIKKYYTPWVVVNTKNWLDNFLKKDMKIFEYGSGESTIYFSQHVKNIYSAEHDNDWFIKIKKMCKKFAIKNCTLFLIKPEKNQDNHDEIYSSSNQIYNNLSFEKYCKKIKDFPDNYFDLIFIDGRARNGCLLHSLLKIKKHGAIILDNSEREEYNQGKTSLATFEKIIFQGQGFEGLREWETTIWIIN